MRKYVKRGINLKTAIVIGSGIAGLASAVRLSQKGYLVKVFEKNPGPGGKINQFFEKGFRFDMGPTLFTMPWLVDELVNTVSAEQDFKYRSLDIICKYFYEDGTILNAYQDVKKFAGEIEQKTGVEGKQLVRFIKKSKTLYDLTSEIFLFNAFQSLKTLVSPNFFKALFFWYKLDAFKTMHQVNTKFFKDQRLVQLFDRYATYNGSNPYEAPGTLNVIPYLEHQLGAFFPEKGMFSIVESIHSRAISLGVEFYFNHEVEKILRSGNIVTGVKVGGKEHHSDIVVSNADIVPTYKLISNTVVPEFYRKQERSSSALIFYWGMNRKFPDLELHNILFSANYKKEFDCLFIEKTIYEDPTVYIFISKKAVPGDAPSSMENWFVMINAPQNLEQDWNKIISLARENIIRKINRILGVKVEHHVVVEKILDPETIENSTSSYMGSLYGTSSNSKFAAFARHPNFRKKYQGLYFCGGSVHPGGGIPLCLSSAKIVASMIQ